MISAIAALVIGQSVVKTPGATWLTDFNKAVAAAKKTNRPILINFTGSDWCGWCHRLEKEVFSQKEFGTYAKSSFVLLELDYPQFKKQAANVKKQNEEIAMKYRVQNFPTVLVINAKGGVLAESGYQRGGASAWINSLKASLKKS
jgi:thioredoxin-related protein